MFQPHRTAALDALKHFVPHAGADYASGRNYDPGPSQRGRVSRLSPWIRTRMLPEWEVLQSVLEQHSATAASKFIDEVCWRSYWKGWLQLRPGIWADYQAACTQLKRAFGHHEGYRMACAGRTGIECFDAWVRELLQTHHLHNHARMWFASIWVHTLKLPWELGADLFLRNLLDGDAASNTLSWRWVAGLHTAGKAYLANSANIRKYTHGRFQDSVHLADAALELEAVPLPKPRSLSELPPPPANLRLACIVTEEDLSSADWIPARYEIVTTRGYFPRAAYEALGIAAPITQFRRQSLADSCKEAAVESLAELRTWIEDEALEAIVLAEPAVGHWGPVLDELAAQIQVPIYQVRHWWDEHMHPHASHGFFRFKKAIPKALAALQTRTHA